MNIQEELLEISAFQLEGNVSAGVQPLSVVDNSDISPTHLTAG